MRFFRNRCAFLYSFLRFAFFQTLMKFYNTVKFKIINLTREFNGFQRTTDFRSLVNLLNLIISSFIRFLSAYAFWMKKFNKASLKTLEPRQSPTSNYYLLFNFLRCTSNWYQSIGNNPWNVKKNLKFNHGECYNA